MNPFATLRAQIAAKYPSLKTLPWPERWLARFFGYHYFHAEYEVVNQFPVHSQQATLVLWKGKSYLLRFGWKERAR
jgi:uncharacterized protein YjlB